MAEDGYLKLKLLKSMKSVISFCFWVFFSQTLTTVLTTRVKMVLSAWMESIAMRATVQLDSPEHIAKRVIKSQRKARYFTSSTL